MYAQMIESEKSREDPERLAAFQGRIDAGEKIEVVRYSFDGFKNLKNDPKMRYYNEKLLNPVQSLEELVNLPALYDYGN